MTTFRCLSSAAACLLALSTSLTHAATLPADGSWLALTVDGNLPPYTLAFIDDQYLAQTYSVDVPTGLWGRLTLVDAGFSGDRFTVKDGATTLGTTGSATPGDLNGPTQFDYDAALADPAYSRGVWVLGAGHHDISGWLSTSLGDGTNPLNATGAGLKLEVTAVPEPASFATLAAGLLLMGLLLQRRGDRR